ncbi:uncharacterized protein [Periplaneta americana]|uniref:uncharacterized protein n=1 Tax=Periplaneta americana TaxID=6978 RepID=UPI0037E82E14
MRVSPALFLLLQCFNNDVASLDNAIVAQVVASVRRIFNSQCIFLLFSSDFKNFILEDLEKRLTDLQMEVSAISFDMWATSSENTSWRHRQPLCVTIVNNQTTSGLLKVTSATDLARAKWLVFLEAGLLMERVLEGIIIPFHCEFLVVQPGPAAFVLTEVYHVSPSLPLQTYNFGTWTVRDGLTWPTNAFYQRRNNMKGAVLRVGNYEASV